MYSLGDEVCDCEFIFMGEMGFDLGIDYMLVMQKIDEIKDKGGKFFLFCFYMGGFVVLESDINFWYYKFIWNLCNVVLVGQGIV